MLTSMLATHPTAQPRLMIQANMGHGKTTRDRKKNLNLGFSTHRIVTDQQLGHASTCELRAKVRPCPFRQRMQGRRMYRRIGYGYAP
ncbi:hypothetical protein V8C40DRAFT_158796 [Trichoderma camerunense]